MPSRPLILVSNDDGYRSEGLAALVEASHNKEVPSWLEVDSDNKLVRVVSVVGQAHGDNGLRGTWV